MDLLVEFAAGDDDAADAARAGLGRNLRSLAADGFLDLVEAIIHSVGPARIPGRKPGRRSGLLAAPVLESGSGNRKAGGCPEGPARASEPGRARGGPCDGDVVGLPRRRRAGPRGGCTVARWTPFASLPPNSCGSPTSEGALLPRMSRRLAPREGRHPQRMTCAFGEAIAELAGRSSGLAGSHHGSASWVGPGRPRL